MKDYHKAQRGDYVSMALVLLGYTIILFDSNFSRFSFWINVILVSSATILITLWGRLPRSRQYTEDLRIFRENWHYKEAAE